MGRQVVMGEKKQEFGIFFHALRHHSNTYSKI